MILSVFSIYDIGVSTWLRPMFARNKGEMVRQFSEGVNDSKSSISRYADDYVLYEIGTWNDDTCEFNLHKAPIKIGVAREFLKPEPQNQLKDIGSGASV